MVISEKCNCCVHDSVCGFKDEYLSACDAIKKTAYTTGKARDGVVFVKDSPVSVSIKCPHFDGRTQYPYWKWRGVCYENSKEG